MYRNLLWRKLQQGDIFLRRLPVSLNFPQK